MTAIAAGLASGAGTRLVLPALLALVLALSIWLVTGTLSFEARATLIVFVVAAIGWTLTPIDDTTIALAACLALIGAGSIDQTQLHAALGHELIWLILAVLLIAAVLRQTALVERITLAAVSGVRSISRLFHVLTLCIGATAFVIPSTSARAAILLPVFLALSDALRRPRLTRALSLLFPSVILLSACGVLTGAGAHLIALDLLQSIPSGERIGYLRWLALALPIAVISSHAAAFLILRLFLDSDERASRPCLPARSRTHIPKREWRILAIVVGTIVLWSTSEQHGVGLATVGLASALLLTLPDVSGIGLKKTIRCVEWELLLFLAATLLLGEALLSSGAAAWLTGALLAAFRSHASASPPAAAALVATVALLSHLVIVSRSARAAVLIPSLAIPAAGLGYSPVSVVLMIVVGTGFCQTLGVSAKAVTIYGAVDRPAFAAGDLLRLSAILLPLLLALLLLFALIIWPALGLPFTRAGIAAAP